MVHGREFSNMTFSTNPAQASDFSSRVLALVGQRWRTDSYRVLEVGSGDGGKLLRLAEAWPSAEFTGIDISAPNSRLAEQHRLQSAARNRVRFIHGDYLTAAVGRFDLILADSVLHLIPCATQRLFDRLASNLNPGGLIVFSMPCACLFNRLLFGVRRLLRLLRCGLTDRFLLKLASSLHRGAYSVDFLRERVNYMYIIPDRVGSTAMEQDLAAEYQWSLEAVSSEPHRSFGQPKHRLWCFQNHRAIPATDGQARSA
jgi:SAM-dependent methyltransferase